MGYDQSAFWYSADDRGEGGKSPLDSINHRFVGIEDKSGVLTKGKFLFFGAHLYFEFYDAGGILQLVKVGNAGPRSIPDEDPAYAYRIVDLMDGVTVISSRESSRFKIDQRLPEGAEHPESTKNRLAIESYLKTVASLTRLTGRSFTLDPKSISTEGAFPLHLDYFGFTKLTLGSPYEMGGYWYISAYSDRTFSEFSPQGFRNEEITFRVDIHENGEIRLLGSRSSLIRARELVTAPFRVDAENLDVRAQKYWPLIGWPAVQRASFCGRTISNVGTASNSQ